MFSAHSENESATESPGEPPSGGFNKKIIFLAFASIGVVFGDIGTSPLYAIKACFYGQHALAPDITNILGVLSLIFWSMFVIVSIKYVIFLLRADNRGEGGIFALVSLLNVSKKSFSPLVQSVLVLAGILAPGFCTGMASLRRPYRFFPQLKDWRLLPMLLRLLYCR